MANLESESFPLGAYLGALRERAGFTQAEVAKKMTVSPAQVSRIEGGDKNVTREELGDFLAALGTSDAKDFKAFLKQDWKELPRPQFDHPDRAQLWSAELALQEITSFYQDPNLKHVFKRQIEACEKEIRRYAEYLHSRDHILAMIGAIGVGKTTGICSLVELEVPRKDSDAKEPALEVGGGGVTICEVQVKHGPHYGIIVAPRTDVEIRADVAEFCEYIMGVVQGTAVLVDDEQDGQDNSLGISKEIVRAIRNMAKLTMRKKKTKDGKILREDPAKELASKVTDVRELMVKVLERMDLARRDRQDLWYPSGSGKSALSWLQETFAAINNCRHPDFSLPARIEVVIPKPLLDITDFNLRIVDTKGIDQTAGRPDLEPHFDDPQTIVVLCSKFNDAPDNYTQQLLRRAKEIGIADISLKTAILVLPRPDEARAMKEDDGTRAESDADGYDLKREQVEMRLHMLGLDAVNMAFFNVRNESPAQLKTFLLESIQKLRSLYRDKIDQLAHAAKNLIANHENEQAQAAIRDAAKRLSTWLSNNRAIDNLVVQVQESLLGTMQQSHVSTIRASVRRDGHWPNLDYPHHLGFGARSVAARCVMGKVDGFKSIAENILQDSDLSDAHEFVQQAVHLLESSTDAFLKRTQLAGQSAFTEDLGNDQDFWTDCMSEWGAGPGYRDRVTNRNGDWFSDPTHQGPHEFVRNMIVAGWEQIMDDLRRLLQIDALAKAAS
jgi:transcriptional regulator with XRE-family HTH domain